MAHLNTAPYWQTRPKIFFFLFLFAELLHAQLRLWYHCVWEFPFMSDENWIFPFSSRDFWDCVWVLSLWSRMWCRLCLCWCAREDETTSLFVNPISFTFSSDKIFFGKFDFMIFRSATCTCEIFLTMRFLWILREFSERLFFFAFLMIFRDSTSRKKIPQKYSTMDGKMIFGLTMNFHKNFLPSHFSRFFAFPVKCPMQLSPLHFLQLSLNVLSILITLNDDKQK